MIIIFGLVLIIWSGYYSIANFSNIFGSGELGLNLIPDYTEVKEKNILKYYESNDLQSDVKLADEVLNKNKYSIISYNIKAYYDCNEKLYDDMIIQKKSAIALDKYNIQMYDDYILLLSRSIENSIKLNDYDNANKYIGYVLEVENTDNLSYKLKDAPVFELSDSSKKYLDVLKENNK